MTRREFAERFRTARKAEKRFDFVWTVVFFGVLVGNWLWIRVCDPEMPDSFWIAYMIVLFGFLFGNIAFTLYMAKKFQRDAGLRCTICQKVLDRRAAALALIKGTCSHCSQKFLTD